MLGALAEAMALPTGLVSAAFLTRNLGLELYGLIGVVVAAVGPFAFIAASVFGMRSGVKIVTDAVDQRAAASAILRSSLAIGALGMAAFAFAAPAIADQLGQPDIVYALRIASAEILLMTVARTHRDSLVAIGNYSWAGLAAGSFHVVRLVFVIVLIELGFGIETVMWAIIAGRLAEIFWCRLSFAIPLWQPYKLFTLANGQLIGPTFLNGLCRRITGGLDILLLTALGAANPVISLFSAAKMLAMMPMIANPVFTPGILSALAQARHEKDKHRHRELTENAWRLSAVISGFTIVAIGSAPTLMAIIFGAAFRDGAVLLALLLVGAIGALFNDLLSCELIAQDRSMPPLYVSAATLFVSIPLFYFVVPRYGAVGAAAVGSGVQISAGLLWICFSEAGMRIRGRWIVRGLLSGAVGGSVAFLLGSYHLPVVDFIVGSAATTAMMFLTRLVDVGTISRAIAQMRQR
jgi:O-antigen/teichoic acid export membrane protein